MLLGEPEWRAMAEAVDRDPTRLVSAVSVVEASMVAVGRLGDDGIDELDLLLTRLGCVTQSVTPTDIKFVRSAFVRYGKGRHPAGLNFGDCFSYALAHTRGESLLFKGGDFGQTDIGIVVY